jgi:hypothetical protein
MSPTRSGPRTGGSSRSTRTPPTRPERLAYAALRPNQSITRR